MILLFPMTLRGRLVEVQCEFDSETGADVESIVDWDTLDRYDWELTEEESYNLQTAAASEAACAATMPDPDDIAGEFDSY